jgi:hypothetical protein
MISTAAAVSAPQPAQSFVAGNSPLATIVSIKRPGLSVAVRPDIRFNSDRDGTANMHPHLHTRRIPA